MPLPLVASAALTLTPELIKIGSGIGQKIKAKKLSQGLQRPEYKTPASVREAVSNARIAAINPEFAGQRQLESKLRASTGSAVDRMTQASSSGSEVLNAISGLHGKEVEGMRDIGISAQQAQAQDMANLNRALADQGRYEEKAFDVNRMEPYKKKAAAISALKGAGAKNIYSGVAGLGQGVSMLGGAPPKLGATGINQGGEGVVTPQGDDSALSALRQAFPEKTDEEMKRIMAQIGLQSIK